VPVALTVHAATGSVAASNDGHLAPASPERLDLVEAGWLASATAATLAGIDRTSRRANEDLVAALVRFELLLRQAQRAAAGVATAAPSPRSPRAEHVRTASEQLREQLAEALGNEGLDDAQTSARIHLGLAVAGATTTNATAITPTPESPSPVQIRPIGRPWAFLGELRGPARFLWTPGPSPSDPRADAETPWTLAIALIAALAPVAAGFAAARERVRRALGLACLPALLALVGYWAGPAWLAAGLGCAALGRLARV
jgi:hypothetical protein